MTPNFRKHLSKVRHEVFWPPFILLIAALLCSLWDRSLFLTVTTATNNFIIDHFGWWFSGGSLLMVLTCFALLFSPIAKVKIGGPKATPILNKWQWFSIVLCTTIATGIIFWGTAEPIFHLISPPNFLSNSNNTDGVNALSLVFLHWSFTPYAIYCIPALAFAVAFYNKKLPFSLQSTLFPLFTSKNKVFASVIDGICLFALIAGMSASLGAGILTLSGGIHSLFGFTSEALTALLTILIVAAFIISAISGLNKGIKILSDINLRVFILLGIFVFFSADFLSILSLAGSALQQYVTEFFNYGTLAIQYPEDPWPKSWTTFNWANWMAWAPITALFLGRIGYGYTIRQFLIFNWILPAVFGLIWMSIFSGISIDLATDKGVNLQQVLQAEGAEYIIYSIFEHLPWTQLVAVLFLVTALLSYVTAADSNTEAMSGLSATGISPDDPTPPIVVKIIWGITIGSISYIMLELAGIEGIKMLSNIGGLPALFLITAVTIGMVINLIKGKI